jgi:hypothetical protein
MLVGYNTNVPYKGKVYHIQTEDNGIKNPVIITLLYFHGSILASKKISYAHFAGSPDYKEKVRELMKEQHKTMIKELIRGRHTGEETPVPSGPEERPVNAEVRETAAEDRISKSLDDVLLEFILKKGHNPH